jgi:hypothetical protein
MERWASITLRTAAITLVAGLTVVVSLLLLLFGMCSAKSFEGKNPQRLGPYLIVVGMVLAVGVAASARIARGIPAATDDRDNQPSRGRRALHTLLYLIGVQIVLTAAVTCLDYLRLWPGSRPNPPRDWGQFLFVYLALAKPPTPRCSALFSENSPVAPSPSPSLCPECCCSSVFHSFSCTLAIPCTLRRVC